MAELDDRVSCRRANPNYNEIDDTFSRLVQLHSEGGFKVVLWDPGQQNVVIFSIYKQIGRRFSGMRKIGSLEQVQVAKYASTTYSRYSHVKETVYVLFLFPVRLVLILSQYSWTRSIEWQPKETPTFNGPERQLSEYCRLFPNTDDGISKEGSMGVSIPRCEVRIIWRYLYDTSLSQLKGYSIEEIRILDLERIVMGPEAWGYTSIENIPLWDAYEVFDTKNKDGRYPNMLTLESSMSKRYWVMWAPLSSG